MTPWILVLILLSILFLTISFLPPVQNRKWIFRFLAIGSVAILLVEYYSTDEAPILQPQPDEITTSVAATSPVSPISADSPIVLPFPSPTPTPTPSVMLSEITVQGCIAFHSNRNNQFDIFLMKEDAGNITQLTSDPARDIEPDWSPDGTQIAFATGREDTTSTQIYVMNADGSDQHRVGPKRPNDNWRPDWSPDGKKLVFQSNRDGNFEIYVMNVDGTDETNLTNDASNDSDPKWSPKGNQLAFVSTRTGQTQVYLMNADGTDVTQLTFDDTRKAQPAWSQDGSNLYWEVEGNLWRIDMQTQESEAFLVDPSLNITPVEMNDENHLLFSSDRLGYWQLYLWDVVKQEVLRLSFSSSDNRFPDWTASCP